MTTEKIGEGDFPAACKCGGQSKSYRKCRKCGCWVGATYPPEQVSK